MLVLLLLAVQRGAPNECVADPCFVGGSASCPEAATTVVVTEAAVTVAAAAGTVAVSSVVAVMHPQHPAQAAFDDVWSAGVRCRHHRGHFRGSWWGSRDNGGWVESSRSDG